MGDSTKRYDLDGFEQTAFLTSYKEPKSSTTCCGYTDIGSLFRSPD